MISIKTVTVLGANGVMGRNIAGILASFGNATVYMVCRNLVDGEKAKEIAAKSVRADAVKKNLIPKTYDQLKECIIDSDLIFESVTEDIEVKKDVYTYISQYIRPKTIIATGTSGLSVNQLSQSFNKDIRKRYLGVHFYNPPYNMTLCEVIPSQHTEDSIRKEMKRYLEEVLYRDVVEVKDEPAFMGNRIGFQFINEALQYAEIYKEVGGIDYIDAILGGFTGRSMPPLVTANFVGLDVHKAIVDNIYRNTCDYAHHTFVLPNYIEQLILENKLGRKTGAGLYRTIVDETGKKIVEVFDILTKQYRPVRNYKFRFAEDMKEFLSNGRYKEAMERLVNDDSKEAKLCLQFLIKYVLYGLYITKTVGESIHSADHVMATGFKWIPPLALINAFQSVRSFKDIIEDEMSEEYKDNYDFKLYLAGLEDSTYDYRPFLKAK